MTKTSATLTVLALTAGLLVCDVVVLPGGADVVTPRTQEIPVAQGQLRPLTSAVASVVEAASQQSAQASAEPSPEPSLEPSADPPTDLLLQSEVLETQDFTVAGVTWDGDATDPRGVEVRVREDGGWTGWETLQPNDDGPDMGTEEYRRARAVSATDPLVSGGADAIQVRVATVDGVRPDGLTVVVIDPGSSPGDTTSQTAPLTSSDAAVASPPIVSRAQWGADESLRGCAPSYSSSIKAATIHHTAGSNTYSAAESAGVVRGIYAYHTRSLGWCDIGYNFLVDKYGTIFEGRFGGTSRAVVGAHAGGFNANTFGVSAMGNYEAAAAPAVMVDAIASVVAWKLSLADVQPFARTTLVSAGGGTSRYAAGTSVSLPTVFGHRDVGLTACPGSGLYSRLDTIRTTALSRMGDGHFVSALYLDMLSRTPASSEVSYWVPYVAASNGRANVSAGFSASEEYRKKAITAAYGGILARQPEVSGLNAWYGEVLGGRTRIDDIRRTFLASEEFWLQGGGTDAGYVQLLYRRALGRDAGASEVSYWSQQLRSQGRYRVIAAIYDSPESARLRVDRAYREWLVRTAGESERVYWEALVISQGDEAMRQAIMVSQEYYNRAQTR